MKETLREKLESLLINATRRRDQLEGNVKSYLAERNYQVAANCQIKKEQFDLFITSLNDVLK